MGVGMFSPRMQMSPPACTSCRRHSTATWPEANANSADLRDYLEPTYLRRPGFAVYVISVL